VVLLSHFVTSPDCICGMAAPLPGCAERSSPKAACGAPEARGLTANAQPELSYLSPRRTKVVQRLFGAVRGTVDCYCGGSPFTDMSRLAA
jgi:hypothetical protein